MENQPWFHGDLSREEAAAILANFVQSQPQGVSLPLAWLGLSH